MKINRVIRFKGRSLNKDIPKECKEVISLKNDASEYMEQEECIVYEESEPEEIFEESGSSAFYQLKQAMEMVIAGRTSNMIGIFGIHADNVIKEMMNDSIFSNMKFLGKIGEIHPPNDIYNYIAAIMFEYLKKGLDARYDLDFERRAICRTISKIYNSPEDDYVVGAPLESLVRTAKREKRDSYILTALNQISRLENYESISRRNSADKFLLIVELQRADYMTLRKLENLQSSDLIIIAYSLFPIEYAIDSTTMQNMRGAGNIIGKFFPTGNYIVAN